MTIDVDQLSNDLSPDSPSGEDLEYDPEFFELSSLAVGKPERAMGSSVIPAEPPNWREVHTSALRLAERTRDLRVAIHLARALVHTEGLTGLRDGLALVQNLLQRQWDHVHPKLDPDDEYDPTMRVNVLAVLDDVSGMVRDVRDMPFVTDRLNKRFALRDVLIAKGELSWREEDGTPPSSGDIEGAFASTSQDALAETVAVVRAARESVTAIEEVLTDRVGAEHAMTLEHLSRTIDDIAKTVAAHMDTEEGATERDGGDLAPSGPDEYGALPAGAFKSRTDVIAALDRACAYFARHEPSSPVPLLLQRAKRLIDKDFMTILRDLAPDAVAQAQMVSGPEETSSTSGDE